MAKKNRTLAELNDNLDSELQWRRQELSFLKNVIPKQENIKQSSFIRANIAMLYAHWEGFMKAVSEHYINYVALRKHNLNELKPCFISRIIRSKGNSKNKTEQEIEKVEFILQELEKRAYVPETSIETKSNLNFTILENILIEIGLTFEDFEPFTTLQGRKETFSKHVVKTEVNNLVSNRNEIAHGKYLKVSYEEFLQTYKIILTVIETIKIKLFELAQTKKYLREIPSI